MVLLPILTFALFLGALIDIILRDQSQVKRLPKLAWIFIVILMPLIGSVLWFAVGREYHTASGRSVLSMPRVGTREPVPQHRQQLAPEPRRALTTEEQLAQVDREIEYYERQAHLERLEAELEAKKRKTSD